MTPTRNLSVKKNEQKKTEMMYILKNQLQVASPLLKYTFPVMHILNEINNPSLKRR